MKVRSLLTLLSVASFATLAQAHFVWLERTADGPAAFFGEWSDNVRENQDGYLKIITAPRAFAPDGSALAVTPKHDRLVVATAPAGDLRLTAHYRPEKGETFVRYYARHGRTDTSAAKLELEIVPVAKGGNTFSIALKGKPLADTEVTLFSSVGWSRKFKTGADGRVTLETPWAGQYVIEVAHIEKTAGEHDGRAHQQVRHVSTLLFDHKA
ncbi:MAG: DUF4198 domain-containing protein [Verrucomicrobiota bacterium]